ncbi:MAG: hypothetical protein JWR83_2335 [Aeromicrobium sp.]|nr:hypothetical protein [Aeromicrobium sp.]
MKPPSLGRRLGALLVDWFIAVFSAAAFTDVAVPPASPRQELIATGFFIAEVALLTGLLGVTIGKRIFGLRVEAPDGRPIGVLRAFVRTVLLALVIPALIMNEDRRGLHDIVAGSRVIRA